MIYKFTMPDVIIQTQRLARGRKNKRANKRGKQSQMMRTALGTTVVAVPPAVNNRANRQIRLRKSPKVSSNGTISKLCYTELWKPIPQGVANYIFNPGQSGLSKLDMFGGNWDQYKVLKAEVWYKTSSGTTTVGHVIMGIDYSVSDLAATMTDVSSLDPREDGPVWQNLALHVNPKQAMTKEIMYCNRTDAENTAFALSIYSDVAAAGLVWVDYEVEFMSPKAAPIVGNVMANTSTVVEPTQSSIYSVGAPDANVENTFDGAQVAVAPSAGTVTSQFSLTDGATTGQQFVVNSTGNTASNGSVQVQFLDYVTKNPLPSSVVHQVSNSSANGLFSAVWQFLKPWVRPVLLSVVETITALNSPGSPALDDEVSHVITDIVPSGIVTSKPTIYLVGMPSLFSATISTSGTSITNSSACYRGVTTFGNPALASGVITTSIIQNASLGLVLKAGTQLVLNQMIGYITATAAAPFFNPTAGLASAVYLGASSGIPSTSNVFTASWVITILADLSVSQVIGTFGANFSTAMAGTIYASQVYAISESTAVVSSGNMPAPTLG